MLGIAILVIVVGALIFGGSVSGAARSLKALGKSEFLCDGCKYNHPDTCSQPERPNAVKCPEFRSRSA